MPDILEEFVAVPQQQVAVAPRMIAPTAEFVARGLSPTPTAPTPTLINHGGPVLGNVHVIPIYWGAAWANATNVPIASRLDAFFDFILTSPYMDLLHEYSTPTTQINHGTRAASVHLTGSEPGTVTPTGRQIVDGQVQFALTGWIAAGTVPATTANTLYFIYLPPGVTSLSFGQQSCGSPGYCGYHNHVGGTVFYALIPYANCSGCTFSGPFVDTLTEVSSHELAEAITDPALNAWFDPLPFNGDQGGDEIGDLCNRQTTTMGGFVVQTEWSNAQAACVFSPPPVAHPPLRGSGGWVTAWGQNRLDLFGIGTDGAMYHKAWNGSAWSPSPLNWERLGGVFTSEPAVVSWGQDRLDIFALGTDGAMYHKAWNGSAWSPSTLGWEALGGLFTSPPAVASWGQDRLDIFGLGTDGAMYHKAWNGSAWSPSPTAWERLGGVFSSPPAVAAWGQNRLDIFGLGTDGAMYHKAWNGSAWSPSPLDWERLGGVFTSPPAVAAWGQNRLDIFGLGTDGAMYHKAWNGSAWSPSPLDWERLGGVFSSPPAVAAWGQNRLDIFGLGTDGAVFHKAWNGAAWSPSPSAWERLGGIFSSAPAVAAWGQNRLDIFGLGADGAMYHKAWNGTAWSPSPTDWERLGGVFTAP